MEENNTNVMKPVEADAVIEDIIEESTPKYDLNDPMFQSPKFVLSNSQELEAVEEPEPVSQPQSPGPNRKVQFSDFQQSIEQPAPVLNRSLRKKNPKVEAFYRDIKDEAIDSAAAKKMKAKMDAELKEKITLSTQIKMYLQEFPELRERAQLRKKVYSEDDDIETLRNTKKTLEQTRGMGKTVTTAKSYFTYLCGFLESSLNGSPLLGGLDITNLGAASPKLAEGFDDEIKEIAIKYSWFFYQPVELRFAMKFWQMLKEVSYMNQNGLMGNIPQPPKEMDPEIVDRYGDL